MTKYANIYLRLCALPWNPPVSNSHFPMSGRFPRGLGIYVYTALKPVQEIVLSEEKRSHRDRLRIGFYVLNFLSILSDFSLTRETDIKITQSQKLKGQIISKCPFGVFVSTKKPTKRFRPQPLKRGQIKKVINEIIFK